MPKNLKVVGTNTVKTDALKLACGSPSFVDDIKIDGLLEVKILKSPHAHALIKRIDASKARELKGVKAVLTYQDVPRRPYTTAGQGYPEPSPYDTYLLDKKVRYVGDRVAAVAAETAEIAEKALSLIEVEYEVLPAVFSIEEAMAEGAPIIHDEEESTGIHDASHNLAAHLNIEVGSTEKGFGEADLVIEREYKVHYVQHACLEPHITITYLDEDNRLVIRTATQVPFHVRRIVAYALGIPVGRIRVIKPRIGGGFGGKQEIITEDICAALTLATKKPVRYALTREEEFINTRTRHPQYITLKTGVKKDGTITANYMKLLANTGYNGAHALTVQCNTGSKALPLYRCNNLKFKADIYYTNLPSAGAMRGYGGPQGLFAVECQMDEIAFLLGLDPIKFRQKNLIREGDNSPLAEALGEGKEGYPQHIYTCALDQCIEKGKELIGWADWQAGKLPRQEGSVRYGIGIAALMHGSGIPGVDMGSAFIKMNEDGSFNLLVGATDLGTGSDTVLAQIAAEVLGISTDKIIVYSSDTDVTPFDVGAYASSTTYITGNAVKKAAEGVRSQILKVAGRMLKEDPDTLFIKNGKVYSRLGDNVSFTDVCLESLYKREQFQIMDTASHISYDCPPPFSAHFVKVAVDTETGQVKVLKYIATVDCGQAINPYLAEGQTEGGVSMGLGWALTEQMLFDEQGRMTNPNFLDYKLVTSLDMPEMTTVLVPTDEPTGPYGAKSVSEIPTDGPAPAVANAIFDAIGIRLRELPFTAEKVLNALKEKNEK